MNGQPSETGQWWVAILFAVCFAAWLIAWGVPTLIQYLLRKWDERDQ